MDSLSHGVNEKKNNWVYVKGEEEWIIQVLWIRNDVFLDPVLRNRNCNFSRGGTGTGNGNVIK
jgi:hypothetical protein